MFISMKKIYVAMIKPHKTSYYSLKNINYFVKYLYKILNIKIQNENIKP